MFQIYLKIELPPVIPFDRDLIKGSCTNYTNKISRTTFLKDWGSKAGIYIIEYKYYPNIYYIGRTNLFKKRFFEHSKAESRSKFHLFIRLVGMEHFNIHIMEICPDFALLFIATLILLPRSGVLVNNGLYNGCGGGKSITLRSLKSFLGNIQPRRLFSVSINLSASSAVPPKPVMAYKNAGVDAERILLENKGKAGVYCWRNLLNQKCYIGSSTNLSRRLKTYFRISFLETQIKTNGSIIYRSLLKNGYSNFSLEILEYCSPENTTLREQYYMDLLNPEYNILKTAGSFLGFKHSEETIEKFRIRACALLNNKNN